VKHLRKKLQNIFNQTVINFLLLTGLNFPLRTFYYVGCYQWNQRDLHWRVSLCCSLSV